MNFNSWVDASPGRAVMVAGHFGITPSAISQWRSNGVPLERMSDMRTLSDGELSIEEMAIEAAALKAAKAREAA